MPQTHYQNLGVQENAPPAEIKKAFRRLALKYHPDKNFGNPKSEAIFKLINSSYAILSDPVSKSKYDASLRRERSNSYSAPGARQSNTKPNPTAASRSGASNSKQRATTSNPRGRKHIDLASLVWWVVQRPRVLILVLVAISVIYPPIEGFVEEHLSGYVMETVEPYDHHLQSASSSSFKADPAAGESDTRQNKGDSIKRSVIDWEKAQSNSSEQQQTGEITF